MALRSVVLLMLVASVAEVAVVGHEVLMAKGAPDDVSMASRFMPLDEMNDVIAADADPALAEHNLLLAVTKNPWDSHSWISLSAHAETRGDTKAAVGYLEAAAAHNIGREPKWALTNFYFRQGDTAHFLEWANRYRAVSRESEDGLFRMVADTVPGEHGLIASLPNLSCGEFGTAIDVLKARQETVNELVDTMSSNCHDPNSRTSLNLLVGELLMKNQPSRADQVWHKMGYKTSLANPDFEESITGQGFDWRFNKSPDVDFRQRPNAGAVFDFGDHAASGTVLLFQPVLLSPGTKYRLVMNAETNPPGQDDFRWELVELATGAHLKSELDEENINLQPSWEFHAPDAGDKTLALALFYRRTEGTEPFRGRLTLHGVHLVRELGVGSRGVVAMRSH